MACDWFDEWRTGQDQLVVSPSVHAYYYHASLVVVVYYHSTGTIWGISSSWEGRSSSWEFRRGDWVWASSDSNSSLHSRVLQVGSARLDSFSRFNRGLQQPPSCNSASPSCPQRPFSCDSSGGTVEHSGRQNVAEGSGKKSNSIKGGNKSLRQSQKQQTSQSPSTHAASSLMRPNFPTEEGASMPISLNSPSHSCESVFLPTAPVDIPFPEFLRLKEDLRVSISSISSIFRMALICCVVAQWIKIAGALSMWASRLRLKFFDSPLIYKNSTGCSKTGRIGVFWDLENCPVPNGCDIPTVIDKVRAIGNSFGDIQCFRAYGKLEYLARQVCTIPLVLFKWTFPVAGSMAGRHAMNPVLWNDQISKRNENIKMIPQRQVVLSQSFWSSAENVTRGSW